MPKYIVSQPAISPMHRIEIEQIADHNLRTHVAQRLRAFVFTSHHRTHRSCLASTAVSVTVRPYAPTRPAAASDQNGIAMYFSPKDG
jgi:hypothetical protein